MDLGGRGECRDEGQLLEFGELSPRVQGLPALLSLIYLPTCVSALSMYILVFVRMYVLSGALRVQGRRFRRVKTKLTKRVRERRH